MRDFFIDYMVKVNGVEKPLTYFLGEKLGETLTVSEVKKILSLKVGIVLKLREDLIIERTENLDDTQPENM